MFLKPAGFKRLITSAYKGSGLHVANDGEGYIFFGTMWKMWIEKGRLPKKSLGDLIALVRELPEQGEAYMATKDEFQYEAFAALPKSAMELAKSCNLVMDTTRVLMVSMDFVRLLQYGNEGNVVAINERHYELIDPGMVNPDEEDLPIGPLVLQYEDGHFDHDVGICWRNDQMALSFLFGDTKQVEKEISILEAGRIARTDEKI